MNKSADMTDVHYGVGVTVWAVAVLALALVLISLMAYAVLSI